MGDYHSIDPSEDAFHNLTSIAERFEDAIHSSIHEFSAVAAFSGGRSSVGAKYKRMSPAKLPISRSACVTVPPGLSPSSFLESPVVLSNGKVEPSPTTGSLFNEQLMQGSSKNAARLSESLFNEQLMQGSSENAARLSEKNYSGGDAVGVTSSDFEFKFHMGSNTEAGVPSSRLTIPTGLNQRGLFCESQAQRFSQLLETSVEMCEKFSSKDSCVSGRMDVTESSICSTADEFYQGRQLNMVAMDASCCDNKDSSSLTIADKTSDDGYGWRKYGQKLVKGSEFPRCYYKCTYPKCEVKKIFERSPSGHITEIVCKGSHDHPMPQSARRNNVDTLMCFQEEKLGEDLSSVVQQDILNAYNVKPNDSSTLFPLQLSGEDLDGSGSQFHVINDDIDEDDLFLKRRRMEDGLDVAPIVKPIREPRVVVQTVSEVDILDDGYRWRKYGQKVVRGNPNPRSYYKCTSVGCSVRKLVERASDDPKAVITTYEGKHNHDVPTSKNRSNEFPQTTPYSGTFKIKTEDSNSISLDLGVGLNCATGNKTNEQALSLEAEAAQNQFTRSNSGMMAVQSSQIPAFYGFVNGGFNLYGNLENHVEGRGFQMAPPLHPST